MDSDASNFQVPPAIEPSSSSARSNFTASHEIASLVHGANGVTADQHTHLVNAGKMEAQVKEKAETKPRMVCIDYEIQRYYNDK